MEKRWLLSVLAASFLVLTISLGPAMAAEKTYINGIDANFPPFAYVDKTGQANGFDVESMNWIASKMGFKVKHMPIDWDAIVPSLKTNKIDIIASGMSVTEERKKQVTFTIPYWRIVQVLVAKKDSSISVEEALSKGNKIGVQRGTSEAKWMKENLQDKGKDFELVYYDSAPLAVEDLVIGRIVAAAMDDAPAKDATKKKPVKIIGSFGMPDEEFAYAVRPEDTELLKMVNEGLKKLMASPEWEKLKAKYDL